MAHPVFSFDAFIAFCKSKDPNEKFDYNDGDNCACAQYAKSLGMSWVVACQRSKAFDKFDTIASKVTARGVCSATFGELTKALERHEHQMSRIGYYVG